MFSLRLTEWPLPLFSLFYLQYAHMCLCVCAPTGGFPIKNQFGYWDYTDYYNDPEQVNKDFDVLFISGGDDEGYPERTAPVVEAEQKLGVNVIGYHHPGFHVWDVWRFSAREFMQRIFK